MVGYTHVQHAQPLSVAYWLSHYAAHFLRDLQRLKNSYDVTDENPLGAGALAGTSLPIDRALTTRLLGFQRIHEHGLDATSSRDFMLEVLSSIAILNTNWSRLAEEFILWSSYEFRTLTMDDGFAMGSSMMPQKKNPGVCELLRGRAGRVNGLVMAGFTLMKGLPSAYNRDFHEDKEILVEALTLVNRATEIIAPLVESTTLNLDRMAELPHFNFSTATELANFLVVKHGMPFRTAHHVVGSLVGDLARAGKDFRERDVVFEHLEKHGVDDSPAAIDAVLDPKSVMQSYNSLGGTGPKAVTAMLDKFVAELESHRRALNSDQVRVETAYEACRNIAKHARSSVKTANDFQTLLDKFAK